MMWADNKLYLFTYIIVRYGTVVLLDSDLPSANSRIYMLFTNSLWSCQIETVSAKFEFFMYKHKACGLKDRNANVETFSK